MHYAQITWQQRFAHLLVFLFLTFLCIHASYIVIIGGSGFFFFYNISLFILLWMIQKQFKWINASFIIALSTLILFSYFHQNELDIAIPLFGYFFLLMTSLKIKTWRYRILIIALVILMTGFNQQQYLNALQQHYAKFQSEDSWHKSAAL